MCSFCLEEVRLLRDTVLHMDDVTLLAIKVSHLSRAKKMLIMEMTYGFVLVVKFQVWRCQYPWVVINYQCVPMNLFMYHFGRIFIRNPHSLRK